MSNTDNENHFNKYIISKIRRELDYKFSYYFSHGLFKLIHFGIYIPDEIENDFKEIEDHVKTNKKSKLYINIERLQGFVYLNNQEFVNYYTDFLELLDDSDSTISFQDLILSIKNIYYLGSVPELRIDPEKILEKYINPHLEKLEESKEDHYIPRLVISRLDRAIGEISRHSSDLSKRLDEKLKFFNDRYLYRQSKEEIDKRNFNEISEYNFRTYLNTASSEEICNLVKSLKDGNKAINDFTTLLERTLKISMNSYNEFLDEESFATNLLDCLIRLRPEFELVENYWLEQSIVAVEKFLKK